MAAARCDGLVPATATHAGKGAPGRSDPELGEEEVARAKKKVQRARGWVIFQDESGVSQKPPLRRTWAPVGQTPVVIHAYHWDKISVCAALAYRWDGKRSRVYLQMLDGNYDTGALIAFLKDLRRHMRKRFVVLVWDNLPAHKSREMLEFLEDNTDWLHVERLPGYAPDLNPVEALWSNIKGQELANQSADNLAEVAGAVQLGFARVKAHRQLTFGFLAEAGLSF